MEKNIKEAIKWLMKAAEYGNDIAEEKLGDINLNDGHLLDGMLWYLRAGYHGNADSWLKLADIQYEEFYGVSDDNNITELFYVLARIYNNNKFVEKYDKKLSVKCTNCNNVKYITDMKLYSRGKNVRDARFVCDNCISNKYHLLLPDIMYEIDYWKEIITEQIKNKEKINSFEYDIDGNEKSDNDLCDEYY